MSDDAAAAMTARLQPKWLQTSTAIHPVPLWLLLERECVDKIISLRFAQNLQQRFSSKNFFALRCGGRGREAAKTVQAIIAFFWLNFFSSPEFFTYLFLLP